MQAATAELIRQLTAYSVLMANPALRATQEAARREALHTVLDAVLDTRIGYVLSQEAGRPGGKVE